MSRISASTDYNVRDQERMRSARRYFEWQYRMCRGALGRRVLEIGCGLGNFTRTLLDRELVVALDVESQCIQQLNATLGHRPNLIPMTMDASSDRLLDLRSNRFDSIVCMNVLEHICHDGALLSRMSSLLPLGGKVVLIVPAFQALYGRIDANLGHYRRYSKAQLRQLAFSAGFRPRVLRYMNSVGFLGWWLNSVTRRTQQSARQIALFDSVIVPVLSRLERAIPPPCGQSLFSVLEKVAEPDSSVLGSAPSTPTCKPSSC